MRLLLLLSLACRSNPHANPKSSPPDTQTTLDTHDPTDCDAIPDPTDPWWPDAGATRLPLSLSAPAGLPLGGVVLFDLNLAALDLDPTLLPTARILLPGCFTEAPDLAVQVEDGLFGLQAAAPHESPLGDGAGTLALRWDPTDAVAPGEGREAWLYLGGAPTSPHATALRAEPTSLTDGTVQIDLSADHGGMPSAVRRGEGPVLLDLTDATGNGAWVGDWASVPAETTGVLTVRAAGPLVGVVESTGSNAGLDWRWTWTVVLGGEIVLLKTHLSAATDLVLDHPGDWANGVRPFQARQDALMPITLTVGDSPWDELDASGVGGGVTLRWLSPPSFRPYRPEAYEGNLIVFGNDVATSSGGVQPVTAGTDVIAHRRLLIVPHDGDPAAAQALLAPWRESVQVQLGAVQFGSE
jgi:hypothetical protein